MLQTSVCAKLPRVVPRGPKPPPAEARHKGAHSAVFVPHFLEKIFSCSFFRRKSQRRPRGENDREAAAHLAERSRKTALIARSFRVLGVRQLLFPTFSHRGSRQVADLPRHTIRSVQDCCRSSCRNPSFSQAEGLHDRTAKSAEEVASTE